MLPDTVTRRLAAIVIADVVGYTRLMERDDTGTFVRLRTVRDEVVDPAIVSHGGRIVKTAGDGLLAEFPSALSALRASVQIQSEMAKRNAGVAPDDRIDYRIGVNLGDVMVEAGDIAGDGVNVASRLESLADPGGICLSSAVREQVHGQLDVALEDIGEQQVKNIARPIRAFAVRWERGDAGATSAGTLPDALQAARGSAPLAERLRLNRRWAISAIATACVAIALGAWWMHVRPVATDVSPAPQAMSVGIVPLHAPPGDAVLTQRAATLTRDLEALLPRTDLLISAVPMPVPVPGAGTEGRGVETASRATHVRYLLDGDLRPGHGVMHVNLRLVDGATRTPIWAESVTLGDVDPPAAHTRSLRTTLERLRSALFDAEIRRVMAQAPGNANAMDLVVRAIAVARTQPDTLRSAREQQSLYEEALRRDPNLVPALLGLAGALDKQNDNDPKLDHEQFVRRMGELTARAVQLNGSHPDTWATRAGALTYMGQWNAALEASARAIQLDPDAKWLVEQHAWLMSMGGRPAEALKLVEKAIAMDPPGGWSAARDACEAHLLLGQYESAIPACEKAKGLSREDWIVDLFLAAAYAHVGDTAKASAARDEVLRHVPGYSIAMLKSRGYSVHPDYVRLAEEHWYSGLRKAGVSEK